MLVAFIGAVGAQQNSITDAGSPESSPAVNEARPGAGIKPLTNERIVSMFKSGISEYTIISLISQFPSEFDASLEALLNLHNAGVSDAVINAIKRRASSQPSAKPEQDKTLTNDSIVSNSADAQKGASAAQKNPASNKWALGLVYPGAAIRYQTSGKIAWEVKAQSGSGVFVAGPRFYYYLGLGSGLSLFCGAEGDYIGFKGKVSKGSGFAGGAFIGGDISLAGQLSLSMDFGPVYVSLSDSKFSESASGMDYILNTGVYWHFK